MDETVKPKAKRQAQVRLENLDANTIRAISRKSGIAIPYLLRDAVSLLQQKHDHIADTQAALGKLKTAVQDS